MHWLFASGHAADLILVVLAGEYIWLVRSMKWRKRDAFFRLAPGALMIIALRGALTGQSWPWIALPLILSFPAHLADLTQPLRQPDEVDR